MSGITGVFFIWSLTFQFVCGVAKFELGEKRRYLWNMDGCMDDDR